MSGDVRLYAPFITEKLDFATIDVYLLRHGVVSTAEYDSYCKALQNGNVTNSDLVRQLLPKLIGKPREFYRALRDHVNNESQDVHPSNWELFCHLPESFGKSIIWKKTIGRLNLPHRRKPLISTITEDPTSSSDTDRQYSKYEKTATYPPFRYGSTMSIPASFLSSQPMQLTRTSQPMQQPRRRKKHSRQPSETSLPHNKHSQLLPRSMSHQHLNMGAHFPRPISALSSESQAYSSSEGLSNAEIDLLTEYLPLGSGSAMSIPASSQSMQMTERNTFFRQSSEPYNQHSLLSRSASHQQMSKDDYVTRQRSASTSDTQARLSSRGASNADSILQAPTPKPRQKKLSSPATVHHSALFTTEKQQSNLISLQMSPEASHTDDCTTYQQQHENGNDAAKFQTTENSSKEQQHKSTLTEENTQTLENSLKEKQQLESSLTEQNTKKYQAHENSLQESIILHVENLIAERFTHLQQQIDSLKQQKSTDSHGEADVYKMQTETEKRKAVKAQETLKQVLAEKEAILNQLSNLKKSHHKLEESNHELLSQQQCIAKKLEDVLKQMDINKKEYEALIKDNKHEVENLKLQIETEQVKTIKTQKVLTQTSTEREEKTKQILTLEENNLELLNQKQSIEKQLEDALKQMDIDKKEYEARIKDYQHEAENENMKAVNTQEVLIQMSTDREEKTKQILTLEENNFELLNQKQSLEKQLEDALKQMDIDKKEYEALIKDNKHEVETLKLQIETEQVKTIKTQEILTQTSTEREEKTKQILTLEEKNFELLNQKQNIEKQLEDVSNQLQIDKENFEATIKTLKIQIEAENEKAIKTQEIFTKMSSEMEEKAKQILALKENNHELLNQKQSIGKQLEDALKQMGIQKKEYETHIKDYQHEAENENMKAVNTQEVLIQMSTDREEKTKQILTLEESNLELLNQKQSIEKQLEDVLKQIDIDKKEYETYIKDYQHEVETEKMKAIKAQEILSQVTAENEEKAKQILALQKNNHELLCREQNIEKQMEDVLKQGKREYESLIKGNENEEVYKIEIEMEKQKVLKAQEVLAQVSAELQEKAKEIIALNENQHKLKSTVEKLEDALTKSNVEHKITEYIKEIQQYKMLNDAEKENAGKAQQALIQVSAELKTKANEILFLEQNLLHEKQSAEKQMQYILEQCDARIKEMENLNKSLQDEKEKTSEKLLQSFTEITNAREIQSTLQNKNSSLLQEKENLESNIKKLQDENNVLTSANKEFDRQLLDSTKKLKNQAELEQETAKMQNTLLQELDKSKEEYHTLEEKFTEVQNEKQNELKRLQNDLELSQSELEKYKLEVKNLEKKLQQKQKFTEFHSPLNVNYKSIEKSNILHLNGEDGKVQEQTSVAQDSTKQVKDEEFAGSYAKLVAMDRLVENPVKDLLTVVLGSNQVSVKKETVGQDQPSETAVNDQPTETIAKELVEGKITKSPDTSAENSNNVVIMRSKYNPSSKGDSSSRRPNDELQQKLNKRLSVELDPNALKKFETKVEQNMNQRRATARLKQAPVHPKQKSGQSETNKGIIKSPSSKTLAQKPQMLKLKTFVIPKIMDHWKDVAVQSLCYDASKIEAIEKRHTDDPKECCLDLFQDWLTTENGVTPKTWEKLITQLREIEELVNEAEEIWKWL